MGHNRCINGSRAFHTMQKLSRLEITIISVAAAIAIPVVGHTVLSTAIQTFAATYCSETCQSYRAIADQIHNARVEACESIKDDQRMPTMRPECIELLGLKK